MSNIIFYFSATGNSLVVARDIAAMLGDTKIVSVADAMKETHIDLPYERIGFVFPAYYISVPPIIKRFVAKLDFDKSQYIFAAITAGGVHGRAFDSLGKFIAQCGGHLNAGFPVQMPGNNITLYGAWPVWFQRYLNKKAKKKTMKIAGAIKEKCPTRIRKGNPIFRITKDTFIERVRDYEKFAKDFLVTDKCTRCGTCAKVCPLSNIVMVDGRPQFGENCERCTACIQWCPVKAIEYKTATTKRRQYRHPDVKASELFHKQQ